MTDVYLIRHAQASMGADDYDCLSPLGEAQAVLLGAWMARGGHRPALVATGRLRRHAQTAQGCLRAAGLDDIPVAVLPGLDELDGDELIARLRPDLASPAAVRAELARSPDPRRAFQVLFEEAVARWTSGRHDHEYGTAWPAFRAAVRDAWLTLAAHQGGETWIFTSGGPISVIVAALLGLPPERTFTLCWPLVNTSVTRIRVGRRAHHLITYNGWAHLGREDEVHLVTHR
ncbi:histidine phosphatase family protein [Telluria mixta]|uniref:Histidine phosphatase family protein n=1 Tax=Telluria mixta TaxID=34071 RepID=A0ABT2BZD3_9BURK|nr:histidine phosphatase family protein [Telluria mixta]MCS0630507.1 histidine phosphatase family protein [Telluria mixta]WEM94188.1 histidine phosphatase family protein [Telluria mixta]